jgi:hypothetical protein
MQTRELGQQLEVSAIGYGAMGRAARITVHGARYSAAARVRVER